MAIVYRTTGAWGAGQGSRLSSAQIDNNFYELEGRLDYIEANPPEAISIDSFEVEGTLLTIHLSNGDEHGPFVLPVAQWRWTGEWAPTTQYFVGDIIENDSNIYFVRVQHISAATFDPGLFGDDGFVYILILAKASQPYDVGMFYNDVIGSGAEVLMMHVAARTVNFAAMFANAQGYLRIATTTSPIVLPVYKNTDVVGTLTFTPGLSLSGAGQYGTWATVDEDSGVELEAGDLLSIGQPYEDDSTASGLVVTIPAVVASL